MTGRRVGLRDGVRVAEETSAERALQFFEGTFVEPDYQRTDTVVQLGERGEDLVPEPGQDPAFDDLNASFRFRLVSGFSGAGRYHRNLIMLSQLLIGWIEFGS